MHIIVNSFKEAVALAGKFFNLSLPCGIGDLKSAYRKASRELHPDLGGDEEAFKEMRNAYEFLLGLHGKSLGIFKEKEIDSNSKKTVEGISLHNLGQGLGPTQNGRDCPDCEHRGYTVEFGREWKYCDYCDDFGYIPREFPCRACNGTGKFTQASKRVVNCRICNGTGIFKHPYLRTICPKCRGSKTIWGKDESSPKYRVCSKCEGKGEIPIWNPVIPKGRLG
jgi:DnaJ-class molecular chaperone